MDLEIKTFDNIPFDILIEIFQYLSIEDLSSAKYVCKSWHNIIEDSFLWKDVSFKPPLGMKSGKVKLLLSNSPFLKSFEFREGLKMDEIVDALCLYNQCITSLSFGSFQVNQNTMNKLLLSFPDLEYLQLPLSEFMSNLVILASFPKLKKVRCTHVFQSNIHARWDSSIPFNDEHWPSLTSLEVLSEHVDSGFEHLFDFIGKRLVHLHIQAVRCPSALLRIRNCVKLERLTMNLLSRQLFEIELEEVFAGLKNLKKLKYLNLRSFVHPDANVLSKIFNDTIFTQLCEIDLSHCINFNYQAAKSMVQACPQLKIICLHGCIVLDDLCLDELSRCSNLRVLNVAGCRNITETGLSHLSRCMKLHELNLNWIGVISLPMLQEIVKIKNIGILHLDHTELNFDHLLNAVKSMPKLKQLSVYRTVGVNGVLLPKCLPGVHVKYMKPTLHNIIQEKVNCLTSLELNGVPNDVLEPIKDCKLLEELTMNFLMRPCFKFRDFIPTLQSFVNLKVLSLKSFVATEDGLLCQLFSGGLPVLAQLNFECCLSVNQSVAEAIAQHHSQLSKLSMKGCVALNDQGLLALAELKCLDVLDVSGCQGLSDKGLIHLGQFQSLKELKICGMAVGAVTKNVILSIVSLKEISTVHADNSDDIQAFMKKRKWHSSLITNCGRDALYVAC